MRVDLLPSWNEYLNTMLESTYPSTFQIDNKFILEITMRYCSDKYFSYNLPRGELQPPIEELTADIGNLVYNQETLFMTLIIIQISILYSAYISKKNCCTF